MDDASTVMSRKRMALEITIVALVPFLLLAPFANKAFHIDDTISMWVAMHIHEHPFDFFGFEMNWYGTKSPVSEFNMNPPGISYFLAGVALIFGWGEVPLHLAMALLASFSIVGVYLLTRELGGIAIVAALACATTPVFFVSSNTVMSDIPMFTCYVWAIYMWVVGTRLQSRALLLAAMVFCCLSIFNKYFGFTIIPVLFLYTALEQKRVGKWAFYFLIPIAFLLAYQLYTFRLYGSNLFTGAAEYTVGYALEETGTPFRTKSLIGLFFLGGCLANFCFFVPLLWSGRAIFRGLWLGLFVSLSAMMVGYVGTQPIAFVGYYNWPMVIHAGVFTLSGCALLALIIRGWRDRPDATTALLIAWFLGTIVFATFLNWSITARTILPLAPPASILLSRLIRDRLPKRALSATFAVSCALLLSAALSFAVAWGDFHLADAQRAASYKYARDAAGYEHQYFYKGHWGFQYYMDAKGIPDWDVGDQKVNHGDRIVVAENNSTRADFNPDVARAWYDMRYSLPASSWVTTMHPFVGAGFYSHFWGPLPFAFGNVPAEYYAVYEIGDYRDLPPPQ